MVRNGLVASGSGAWKIPPSWRDMPRKTAAAVGQSKRSVERDLTRGSKIAPAVLAEVAGTSLGKGVVLEPQAGRAPAGTSPPGPGDAAPDKPGAGSGTSAASVIAPAEAASFRAPAARSTAIRRACSTGGALPPGGTPG